jgi:hypothetical protein
MTKEAVLNKRHYDGRITFRMTRHDRNEIFERAKAERISVTGRLSRHLAPLL